MMRTLIVAAVLLAAAAAGAHGLDSSLGRSEAVTVTCLFDDGSPVSFEPYEIAGPGGGPPFQVGRTDRLGRVAFLPDREGEWTVRIMGEDGHGVVVSVPVDAALTTAAADSRPAGLSRWAKMVTGIGILFGVFGMISLGLQRRT